MTKKYCGWVLCCLPDVFSVDLVFMLNLIVDCLVSPYSSDVQTLWEFGH